MAKVKTKQATEYRLTLSEREAEFLHALVDDATGKEAADIYYALKMAGVSTDTNVFYDDVEISGYEVR